MDSTRNSMKIENGKTLNVCPADEDVVELWVGVELWVDVEAFVDVVVFVVRSVVSGTFMVVVFSKYIL